MQRISLRAIATAALAWAVAMAATGVRVSGQQDESGKPGATPPVRYTAQAVSLGARAPNVNQRLDIQIDRWSTEEEREKLRTALVENGTEALYRTLQDMEPVGHIRSATGGVGWQLRYAAPVERDGKQRIVFATDRRMSFAELRAQPRTTEYRFTIGELTVGPDGTGEGRLALAVKPIWMPRSKTLELEQYSSEPIRLLEVRRL